MAQDIYLDESSQTGHRYLVIGGLALPTESVYGMVGVIREARKPKLPRGEMKWGKVSAAKFDAYKNVVDAFFDLNEQNKIHFHCLIADTHQFNHHTYNMGDREIGFNKLVYQMLMKFGRLYTSPYFVYLDSRTTRYTPDDLRLILNRGIAKHYGITDAPYRRVVFRDSKDTELLQLTDVLLGAVASRRNEHHLRPRASRAKTNLSAHILARANITDLSRDTPRRRTRFGVWNFRLSSREESHGPRSLQRPPP